MQNESGERQRQRECQQSEDYFDTCTVISIVGQLSISADISWARTVRMTQGWLTKSETRILVQLSHQNLQSEINTKYTHTKSLEWKQKNENFMNSRISVISKECPSEKPQKFGLFTKFFPMNRRKKWREREEGEAQWSATSSNLSLTFLARRRLNRHASAIG